MTAPQQPTPHPPPRAPRSVLRSRLVPIAALVIGALLIGFVIVTAMRSTRTEPDAAASQSSAAPTSHPLEHRDPNDPMAIGPVDAPVVLVVFSDYQCPYCAKWSHDTLPAMISYADAGKLRIEYRDLNVFGEASVQASRATYAAGLQGKFLPYHRALYPDGVPRSADQLTGAALFDIAEDTGLDMDRFAADINAKSTTSTISNNSSEGFGAGLNSTPAFLIAGQPILGNRPTAEFVTAVEDALDRSGR